MGLGAGWFERDYERYGYEFGTRGRAHPGAGRALPEIIERLATLNPPPLRRMPILIAGTGRTLTLPIVAATPTRGTRASRIDRDELRAGGRRAARLLRGRSAATRPRSSGASGVEPDDLDRFLREDASAYLELGFTQFTLGFNGPDWAVEQGADFLAWRDQVNAAKVA